MLAYVVATVEDVMNGLGISDDQTIDLQRRCREIYRRLEDTPYTERRFNSNDIAKFPYPLIVSLVNGNVLAHGMQEGGLESPSLLDLDKTGANFLIKFNIYEEQCQVE